MEQSNNSNHNMKFLFDNKNLEKSKNKKNQKNNLKKNKYLKKKGEYLYLFFNKYTHNILKR